MIRRLLELIYPRKCVFCGSLLKKDETDLCSVCRDELPFVEKQTQHVPYSTRSVAVLYYEDHVRDSVLRYKFSGHMSYCAAYGRLLAMTVLENALQFDLITYVPVSRKRRRQRGYDQAERLSKMAARELNVRHEQLLTKIRNNPAQSGIRAPEQRRANVLGVYRVKDRSKVAGQNILLIDDVMTTGATLSECCRTLLDSGAASVSCAALACGRHNKNSR